MNNNLQDSKKEVTFNPFSGPEILSVIHTTQSQQELWIACKLGGKDANKAYNESISLNLTGPLDLKAIEKALHNLVNRHESLRAVFSTNGRLMTIFKELEIPLSYYDICNLSDKEKGNKIADYSIKNTEHLFDLVKGPLFKTGLIKVSNQEHILILTAHHIICDGWSMGIILQDLSIMYSAYVENKVPELTTPIAFSDYANQEELFSKSDENKETEKFWHEMFKDPIPIVDIPTDHTRPFLRTYKSNRLDFTLNANLLSSLKQTGTSVGSSLVSTLLTCFEVFLYELTGQDDLVLGLPYAGQPIKEMNHLIGHCVNLLPLRSKPNPDIPFIDYLKQRKSELFDAYDHPELSFGHLLQQLNVARDPSRIPLVPVVFNIDMGMSDGVHFSDLTYKLKSNPRSYDVFELVLNINGSEKDLVFEWSYNEALFKSETIQKMMASFENIVQKIAEDPKQTLGEITVQNFTTQLSEIYGKTISYPNSTLHEIFEERVKMYPNAIAIEFNDNKITYRELGTMINQMANYLWSLGLRPGQIVAVSLEKTPELIVTTYAILQCGAIFLPLDTEYPENRIHNVILNAEASFYISRISSATPAITKFINIDCFFAKITTFSSEALKIKISPESIAYIIYTSGSTGQPKGVQISHSNVVNFVYSMKNTMAINETDIFLSVTSISFDPMVFDVFVSLLLGGTVVFVPRELVLHGSLLLEKIINHKITAIACTPSLWQMLLDSGWDNKLNLKAITGGEVLHKSLANSLLSKCSELWNQYGPTETTVGCFISKVSKEDEIISIGKPMDNTFAFLLDNNKKPVKFGEIGEIAIGGAGVSLGYLNQKELTDKVFIKNTLSKNKNDSNKLYLTGDLAKLLPNGELQYIGRSDQQVKIRGFRIEIGEIEHALMAIFNIKTAIVLVKNDLLVAFIVTKDQINENIDIIQSWRNELVSQLPNYMVPNIFHVLQKIPTTQNDKIDRTALLDYKSNSQDAVKNIAPRTEQEQLVATIWEDTLNLKNIDVYSNFFEIGGHSIKAVKVMIEVEKHIGKRIPLSALFEHPTIEKFAKLLNKESEIFSDCLIALKPNGNKVPLFIVHGAGLNVLNFIDLSSHFDEDQPVYGIQGTAKGYDQWYESIEEMAAHYVEAIIKVNPNGPYALAGFSFGGVVVFEMTRQLKLQGKEVSLTALLDSYADSSYYYETYSTKKLIRYYDTNRKWLDFLKEMMTSRKAFMMHINSKKEYILKRYFGMYNTMTEQESLALEQFIEADSMVNKIVNRYHLKPQNFEVDLFRSKDDNEHKLDPVHLGWKKAAAKGINIHNIPGNHLDILAPPNDKILAGLLQEVLNKKHNSF